MEKSMFFNFVLKCRILIYLQKCAFLQKRKSLSSLTVIMKSYFYFIFLAFVYLILVANYSPCSFGTHTQHSLLVLKKLLNLANWNRYSKKMNLQIMYARVQIFLKLFILCYAHAFTRRNIDQLALSSKPFSLTYQF